jgi:hypothetical protein
MCVIAADQDVGDGRWRRRLGGCRVGQRCPVHARRRWRHLHAIAIPSAVTDPRLAGAPFRRAARRDTLSRRVARSIGFSRTSTAPHARAELEVSAAQCPVVNNTGTFGSRRRSSLTTSTPFIPGRDMSLTMASYELRSISRIAATPSAQPTTTYPARLSTFVRTTRTAGSSSTTSIRFDPASELAWPDSPAAPHPSTSFMLGRYALLDRNDKHVSDQSARCIPTASAQSRSPAAGRRSGADPRPSRPEAALLRLPAAAERRAHLPKYRRRAELSSLRARRLEGRSIGRPPHLQVRRCGPLAISSRSLMAVRREQSSAPMPNPGNAK